MNKQRIDNLKKLMTKKGIDVLFVSNPTNVFYLSGFKCLSSGNVQTLSDPEAFLLIENKGSTSKSIILTDSRNEGTARKIDGFSFVSLPYPTNAVSLSDLLKKMVFKSDNFAFEEDSFIYTDLKSIKSQLRSKSIDASKMIAELRNIKDDTEIKKLKKAAKLTSDGFEYALSVLQQGMTEKELASKITKFFIDNADGNSFDPIVAFGKNSAIPHYETGNTKIEGSGILLIDLGAKLDGYCGDMTRTVFIGEAPDKFKRLYEMVLKAQKSCINNIYSGMTGQAADSLARDILENELKELFTHGTGHGLGLDLHEAPKLNKVSDNKLLDGMVFSVEPGVYLPDFGGIRIEDVVVLKDGKPINLTRTSKSLKEIKL